MTVYTCKCCLQPARVVEQPALTGWRDATPPPPALLIDCIQPGCANQWNTQDSRDAEAVERLYVKAAQS